MAPHSGDKSLLDRLNALKPTSVNLDRSTNALDIPTTGTDHASSAAEPLSREDALTERLRSLRNRGDNHDPPPPYSPSPPATRPQPQPPSAVRATGLSSPGVGTVSSRRSDDAAEGGSQSSGDYDHYFDDVLQPLDLDEDVSDSDGGGGPSRRVEDLLARLKAAPGAAAARPPLPAGDNKPDQSDDDSEGEAMSHEVEDVISRAMDALDLDGPRGGDSGAGGGDGDGDALALPTVPQDAADEGQEDTASSSSQKPRPPAGRTNNDDTTAAGLSLPTVPTALVDPAPTSGAIPNPSGSSDPFESSIEARLAALKGAGAPIIRTDALGLPSAPTFRPEDNRGASRAAGPGKGYTDADQKTWCIVCLEDATVRCLGCAEDGSGVGEVYCARCWREMHVGPSAGYDERGHAWEKFDPRRL
ncbi:hypothetical protein KVR01_010236 [Diaporthe batatas]|uniref:uncharacterized protein n=1 Tax=Diaporthe batatas TaxID=748121 RepID=UPI001D046B20|nr:uncharacterized protein KVR01_010236 [Diaporthe batatas]KAG8159599.1 hypothetical protein KVR01_010236 [Diaporthe batatas]